jgi:hypothetical protein
MSSADVEPARPPRAEKLAIVRAVESLRRIRSGSLARREREALS